MSEKNKPSSQSRPFISSLFTKSPENHEIKL